VSQNSTSKSRENSEAGFIVFCKYGKRAGFFSADLEVSVNCAAASGGNMYPFLECLALAFVVVVLGATLFLAMALFVLAEETARFIGRKSQSVASRAKLNLGKNMEPLVQPASQSN
jgi:hypothetical protein